MAKKKSGGKRKASKKVAPKKGGSKAARAKGPRSQPLPGMEQVRNRTLDNVCESIAEERATLNQAKAEEIGLVQSALQVMQRNGISVYRHARIELSRVPGAEKLRVRLTKEEGDAGADDLEPPEGEHHGEDGEGAEPAGD